MRQRRQTISPVSYTHLDVYKRQVLYNISCCEKTDVIVGPVGIILGNALHGEVSPAIASAVSQSPAMKILVPSNKCSLYMAGVEQKPLTEYIADAVRKIAELAAGM